MTIYDRVERRCLTEFDLNLFDAYFLHPDKVSAFYDEEWTLALKNSSVRGTR